jgi:hypothetical protein
MVKQKFLRHIILQCQLLPKKAILPHFKPLYYPLITLILQQASLSNAEANSLPPASQGVE